MDMDRPHSRDANEVLEKFLLEAKTLTELNNIRFAVCFIPSKERVFYKYLKQMDTVISKVYEDLVYNEDALKEKICLFLANEDILCVDFLPEMENGLIKYGNIYPTRDDGHPNKIGYQIYAESSFKLVSQIIQ